ncbi:MAG: hemin uptake protein HemP [Lentilitoribacter sp.]
MQVVKSSMDKDNVVKTASPSLIYKSDRLFQGQKEIIIQHEDASYRLRITRQGKLILNK